MNIKPIVYYWARDEFFDSSPENSRVESIKQSGIFPTGGFEPKVYLSPDYKKFYNPHGRTHLFGVDLRGIESSVVLDSAEKWIYVMGIVPARNLFYVGGNFSDLDTVRKYLLKTKTEFLSSFYRADYPLRKDRITLRSVEQPKFSQTLESSGVVSRHW